MLRRTVVGSIVAVVALLAPMAASADTTHNVTVLSTLNYPSGWELASPTVSPVAVGETGPAAPPLGAGSLVVTIPPGDLADLIYTFPADDDHDLTALKLHSYQFPVSGSDTPMLVIAHLYLNQQGSAGYYDLSDPLPSGPVWSSLDLFATSTWQAGANPPYSEPPETVVSPGSGSYPDFLSATSGGTLGQLDVHLDNQNGATTQKYAIDDVLIGLTTGTHPDATITNTTYNFEARPPTVLTAHPSGRTITAGASLTPSVTVSVKSQTDNSGFLVTLSKKTAGSSTYHNVVTRTTDKAGVATAPPQKLSHNTSFRWAYVPLPGSIFAAGSSKIVTVTVAPKVTLHVAKATIGKHGSLHATGTVKPSSGPATIKLIAKKHGRTITAAGHERANGSYSISRHLPAGRYKVQVRVAKDSINGGGTSRHITVVVR
ncbi:MAG TPA: hypothetical protein VHV79_13540 [Mycobacteriales bacterium]|jgi:hypothetical protein|nr:hypothetical protein [Mycobacteriales bacterium]